ncbi:MAG TPA: 5-oxoprolinase subunit PxpB [Rudaea sp.]|jgi:KipI family sensor histidine kinase inhibitor
MSSARIEPLGDSALLVRVGDRIDEETNAAALALAGTLHAARLPGVSDVAPAYASVAVRFDIGAWRAADDQRPAHARLAQRIRELVEALPHEPQTHSTDAANGNDSSAAAAASENRSPANRGDDQIEVPVCYGDAFGPDLDAVAAHAGLDVRDVIARHVQADYRVAMLGFMPGFPYLLGLDATLHAPRRASPRTRVPAGSVAIGGAQTGIYPRELPGGWQLIGRTPLALFDPLRHQPALLRPGQRVRFRRIDADEFEALAR